MKLYGAWSSPYSMKMKSYLHYKRILFIWENGRKDGWPKNVQSLKPGVIPIIQLPNGKIMNESTKMIQFLEKQYKQRNILPKDEYTLYLSNLLEDFADEMLTKVMYGLRWHKSLDSNFAKQFLILSTLPGQNYTKKEFNTFKDIIQQRQVKRCNIVGCNNFDFIDKLFIKILNIFNKHFKNGNCFLFGNKPSNADFGM